MSLKSTNLKDLKRGNKLIMCCASRGRNPNNPSDRRSGIELEQRIEVNLTGFSNAITTLQKDCYIFEVELNK